MGGKPATTTTTSEPNSMQKPGYKLLYEKAKEAFKHSQASAGYDGDFIAGPTAAQVDANQQIIDQSGFLSAGADPLQTLALQQINGDFLHPDTNPFIRDVVDASLRPVQQGFDTNRLAINDKAIAQGAYGGSRQDLQELMALQDYTTTAGDISSNIYAGNYANERQIQQNSGNLLDQANLLKLAGPTAMAGAGAQQQGWDQAALDNAIARYKEMMGSEWAGTSEYANILGSGGFGSQTTVQEDKSNPLLGILQGLMGGASTGASMGMGIGGLAAGAGLGAFAPWMIPFAALGGLAGGL